jgi:proton-translocating NADH-quinone oxidoreductase chain N
MVIADPIYYIALPLITAFLIPILGKINKALVRIVPGIVLAYLAFMSVLLMQKVSPQNPIITEIAGWKAPWGINLVFTSFSGFIASLISILSFIIWVYSYKFKKVEFDDAKKYFILFLLLSAGSIGIVLTGDIFNMFVFIEITSLSSYALISFYKGRDGAEASFKFLLMGGFSSTLLLLGIALIYASTGTLNMAEIALKMPEVPLNIKVISFLLIFVAMGVEAEMFPLNGWAPDAYSQAPGPIAASFAGILAKAGIYALIRIVYTIFDLEGAFDLLLIMGMLTLVISELIAIRQENLRRMLAYSSMGQMGLIMVAFSLGTRDGIYAGLFIMFNHAIIKSLLFLSSAYLVYYTSRKKISDLDGFGKILPLTSLMFGLGAFAIVGLPPFSGFWSKLALLMATADKHLEMVIAVILAVSVIEIIYYFRVISRLYFRKPNFELKVQRPNWNGILAMATLSIAIIAVGIYPDFISNILNQAADALFNKADYIQQIVPELISQKNIIN